MWLAPLKLTKLVNPLVAASICVALATHGQNYNQVTTSQESVEDAPKEKKPKPKIKSLPIPVDYALLAIQDANSLDPTTRLFTRYITNPDYNKNYLKTSSLTFAYTSRASGILRPLPVAHGLLIRVDLRYYAPREADLAEWLGFWEQLAFDPMFSLLITRDTLDFIARVGVNPESFNKKVTHKKLVKQPQRVEKREIEHKGGRFVWPDDSGRIEENAAPGRYLCHLKFNVPDKEEIVTETLNPFTNKDIDVVRQNGNHSPEYIKYMLGLQQLLSTQAPIVDHRYFKHRFLTTIKDKKVYAAVFGGLYYEFRGVKKAKDVLGKDTKASDLDLFFETLGIGNIKAGLNSDQLFDRLRSDQRLAIFRSQITGKPREVISFQTPASKETISWGAITGDIKDGDIDIGDRSYANLLNARRQAREAIFPTVTGFPVFALFNDKGERQDEVPPDIANDHTIPFPYTKRLQPAKGCIICHGIDGSDGWKPLVNDVKKLMSNKLDIFTDFSVKDKFNNDIIDRLAGLYQGDFSKNLRRARDDLAEVTLKATGPWSGGTGDQSDTCKLAAVQLESEMNSYMYTLVDAQQALREEGWEVPKERALEIFRKLHPPDERAFVPELGIVLEDPRIAALKADIAIPREDWSLSYNFALERSLRSPYRKMLIEEAKRR